MLLMLVLRFGAKGGLMLLMPLLLLFGAKGLAADAPDAGPGAKGLAADAPDAGPFPGLGQKGSRLMLLMLVLMSAWGKRAGG